MAIQRWKGGAAAISQFQTWTFAGTWLTTEKNTVVIGSKTLAVVTGSATIATFLATLSAALNALSSTAYPEFAEITWGNTSTTLTASADVAGQPVTVTITTNSASGTIDSGSGDTGVATVASAGPNDWSTAANWQSGSEPASADVGFAQNSTAGILYGLGQSAVTLASLNIGTTFTAPIGLPEINTTKTAYPEYRPQYLAIGATLVNIGCDSGGGQGSGRIKLDNGSVQTTLMCQLTGSPLEQTVEPLQWKGTNSSNVVSILRGSAALAGYATDVATIATLNVGAAAQVRCGSGCTLTTVNQLGGNLTLNSAATTVTGTAGNLTIQGTGAYTTITLDAATLTYLGSGTITTLVIGGNGVADFSMPGPAVTVTNCTMYAGATLNDPAGRVTFSNPILLARCRVADVVLDVGENRHLLPS